VDTNLAQQQQQGQSISQQQSQSSEVASQQPQKTPNQVDFATKYAAMAKKEKQIREREMMWKKEKEEFSPKVQEFEKINGVRERVKTRDPKAIKEALELLGLSASDVSTMALSHEEFQTDPEIERIKREFDLNRKEIEDLKKYKQQKEDEELRTKEDSEYKESIGVLKTKIDETIKSNLDKFDLCSCLNDDIVDMVLDIGNDHASKGEFFPIEKILEMIEDKEEKRQAKFKTSKKFGNLAQSSIKDGSKGTTSPTLTNNFSNQSNVNESFEGLTGDARMNALIQKYKTKRS
jgi:hypothetical protein